MPPWLGYTRVSRVGDRAGRLVSPELQAEQIRAYASSRGLPLELLAPELDVSGGRIERPILDEAIARIERGEAAGVIVSQLDRLSRAGIVATHHLIARIEALGGKVIAVAESFDDSTPEGRMGRNVMLALGEMQLDRYRQGFAQAKAQAVKRGIWPVPKPPRGYVVGPERRLIRSHDAPLVVRCFEARAAGASWRTIADMLQTGATNAAKTIRNRAYLGEIVLGGLRNPAAHEPIVERALWEAAQVKHAAPRRRHSEPALLRGIVYCASCGFSMATDKRRGWTGYRCFPHKAAGRCEAPAMISRRLLDPFVEALILHHLETIAFSQDAPDALSQAQARLDAAEAELDAFQRVQSVSGREDAFASGMRSRVEAVDHARRELGEARSVAALPLSGVGTDVWPSLSVTERNHFLRRSLSSVRVRRGKGDVLGRTKVFDMNGAPVAVPKHLRERFR